jgi:hypothetical protein
MDCPGPFSFSQSLTHKFPFIFTCLHPCVLIVFDHHYWYLPLLPFTTVHLYCPYCFLNYPCCYLHSSPLILIIILTHLHSPYCLLLTFIVIFSSLIVISSSLMTHSNKVYKSVSYHLVPHLDLLSLGLGE